MTWKCGCQFKEKHSIEAWNNSHGTYTNYLLCILWYVCDGRKRVV